MWSEIAVALGHRFPRKVERLLEAYGIGLAYEGLRANP